MPQHDIQWPNKLGPQAFLDQYWQKKPLLIRQAMSGFKTPLPADELAGLSLEPGTTPRLILKDSSGDYHIEHGPFEEARFATLTNNNWSLLVTDVEKYLPELSCYLDPFRFLPDWRIDDLMISYAPDGASVGAHVDQYDVFLLQASGTRRWSIDSRTDIKHTWVENSALKLLANFKATDTWDLQPGDLLYLPPGMPHHGVAVGDDCTTWSIGCRAPGMREILLHYAEVLAEQIEDRRLADIGLSIAVPGEIRSDAIAEITSLWREATQLDTATATILAGQLLTQATVSSELPESPTTTTSRSLNRNRLLTIEPYSRIAWSGDKGAVQLFVNGDTHHCSRTLAIALCSVPIDNSALERLDKDDQELLARLVESGALWQSPE